LGLDQYKIEEVILDNFYEYVIPVVSHPEQSPWITSPCRSMRNTSQHAVSAGSVCRQASLPFRFELIRNE
jgi:inhibitor of KinA sporulation pathway (predicted exonuclease)